MIFKSRMNTPLFFIGITLTLVFAACKGSESNDGTSSLESTDSLVEFEINEERTDAVDFNNEMTFMQEGTLDMIDALFQSDSSNVELNHENCLFELEINISSLKQMKGDTDKMNFVSAMIDLMEFYKKELSTDFLNVITILKKSEFTDKDDAFLKDYDLNFVELEEAAFNKVFISQEAFAKANNISLDFQE